MKFLALKPLLLFICLTAAGCTSIPDIGTRAYVYERMHRVQVGNTSAQVHYLLDGPPSYVTAMPAGADIYEVWEYRIGNFLYAESAMILFRNGLVIALPKNGNELIRILNSAGIVPQAQFWKPNET